LILLFILSIPLRLSDGPEAWVPKDKRLKTVRLDGRDWGLDEALALRGRRRLQ
jgi:hypothetical protein